MAQPPFGDSRCRHRSSWPDHVWRIDHRGGLCASVAARGNRRKTVSPHGADGLVRAARFAGAVDDADAGVGIDLLASTIRRRKKSGSCDCSRSPTCPLVRQCVSAPLATTIVAACIFLISIPIALSLGAEFMPRLNEGDLLVEAVRLPSASLEGAESMAQLVESELLKLPEVKTVFTKTGRPEIANDVMGVHQSDVWVMLHPPEEWPQPKSRDELIGEMEAALTASVPGVAFGFTQPIEMRVDELVAGVKADVAVLLYGEELDTLASESEGD